MASLGFPILRDQHQTQVHASALLLLGSTLLVAWFGGSKEGASDTKIWLSSAQLDGRDGPATWEPPLAVAAEDGQAHWNPVLFQIPGEDRVSLFYKVGSPISRWRTFIIESNDRGRTWGPRGELVAGDIGGRGPVKNKPIYLSRERMILAPGSIETAGRAWDCFVDRSADGGLTWDRSPLVPIDRSTWAGEGAIQPSLIQESDEGRVSMFCRSSTGYVARADSLDGGGTWGQMYRTSLYNNNSGIDAVGLDGGPWLVVHNPVNKNWGPRTPLVISSSLDHGKSWKQILCLEDKPPPPEFVAVTALDTGIENDGQSEFSYPAIIPDGRGGVLVSYTYERQGIKVVHVEASQVS